MMTTKEMIKELNERISAVSNKLEKLENDWDNNYNEIKKLDDLYEEQFETASDKYDELFEKNHQYRIMQDLLEEILENLLKLKFNMEELEELKENL